MTSGFKTGHIAAINVAVNQGLNPAVGCAMICRLSAAVNGDQTGEIRTTVSQESTAEHNPAANRATSPSASYGLTAAFSRELRPALKGALSL
ncbi:hypothetical protein FJY68_10225 [candidate division WOR-3 bacterium]|uniref:Uncharacterized protein n=1 Tax=candidate division WOR-3 bacterium TaxID=2052148 RepID=A0A938BUP9_UNCW3|nr:hypothetical protein [candidate division WOR-3 bacterium]